LELSFSNVPVIAIDCDGLNTLKSTALSETDILLLLKSISAIPVIVDVSSINIVFSITQ
jgi:hypothetical protein